MEIDYIKHIFDTKLDFTFAKYIELCKKILNTGYTLLTMEEYFSLDKKPDRFIIIRHDIDDEIDLAYALKMAKVEAELGMPSTYYFRTCEKVFDKGKLREIAELGHEIGYHYEVLGDAEGDYNNAIKLFETELSKFEDIYVVKTIAQHGGPLRKGLNIVTFSNIIEVLKYLVSGDKIFDSWESKDLWKRYDFREYGIIGEPYLSIDFNEVLYLSDTNRSWMDTKYRLKDYVEIRGSPEIAIKKTDDLIKSIEEGTFQKMHILIHPSNWKERFVEWLRWLILQRVRNAGKRVLMVYWRLKNQ